jgi:DNA-binding NarL/FixJ family response regulator
MKIVILDDNRLFAEGLSHILCKFNHTASIIWMSSLHDYLKYVSPKKKPDIVLVGAQLWRNEPGNFIRLANDHQTPIILMNVDEHMPYQEALPYREISGYILKTYTEEQLAETLQSVLKGEKHIPIPLVERLEKKTGIKSTRGNGNLLRKSLGVTRRQYEVLKLMAQGYSNRMIADTLCLTEHTIKSHVSALFQAMNTKNRTECVLEASQKGLIDPPSQGARYQFSP